MPTVDKPSAESSGSTPQPPHKGASDDAAGAVCHSAGLAGAAPPLLTTDSTQPNWRMMDMRRMIAGGRPDSQHRSPLSPRGEGRSHSQIKLLLKSVSAANRCVDSLNDNVAERRRSSGVASSQHRSSPPPTRATPDGPPQADARGVHFLKQPAGGPAAAALPSLSFRPGLGSPPAALPRLSFKPGSGSPPQRPATPPQQVASKLVKFYGETVRPLLLPLPLQHAS
jgi:hypothetical protein